MIKLTYLFEGWLILLNFYANLKEREALKNEVRIFKDLNHKNIIKFYEAINRSDGLFVFLEYMPDVSIRSKLIMYLILSCLPKYYF